jgi:hypothetical protein
MFGSLNNDELNELRKRNLNQKLIGMIGDFEVTSMNHSESRKGVDSLNNSISDINNIANTHKVRYQNSSSHQPPTHRHKFNR